MAEMRRYVSPPKTQPEIAMKRPTRFCLCIRGRAIKKPQRPPSAMSTVGPFPIRGGQQVRGPRVRVYQVESKDLQSTSIQPER